MATIPMQAVQSSNIAEVGYDDATKTLAVRFKAKVGPGTLYHYAGVPKDKYAGLVDAQSAGQFFIAEIRGNGFTGLKIDEEAQT